MAFATLTPAATMIRIMGLRLDVVLYAVLAAGSVASFASSNSHRRTSPPRGHDVHACAGVAASRSGAAASKRAPAQVSLRRGAAQLAEEKHRGWTLFHISSYVDKAVEVIVLPFTTTEPCFSPCYSPCRMVCAQGRFSSRIT